MSDVTQIELETIAAQRGFLLPNIALSVLSPPKDLEAAERRRAAVTRVNYLFDIAGSVAFAPQPLADSQSGQVSVLYILPELAREVFHEALILDREATQAVAFTYWPFRDPFCELLIDICASDPLCRWQSPTIEDGKVRYFGREAVIRGLPPSSQPLRAFEINLGLLGILDKEGKPLGVLDIHPNTRVKRLTPQGQIIEQKLTPPENVFFQVLGRQREVPREEILDFLASHETFFAQDGDFAQRIGLATTLNLSLIPFETKFAIYQLFKQGISQTDRMTLYKFFQKFRGMGGFILASVAKHPSSIIPLATLASRTEPSLIKEFMHGFEAWIANESRHSVEEIGQRMEAFSTSLLVGEDQAIIAEILGWGSEVQGFSWEMAEAILPKELKTPENVEIIVELAHTIQRRTRAMITAIADLYDRNPNLFLTRPLFLYDERGRPVEKHVFVHPEARLLLDGIRSQAAFLSVISAQGVEGLERELNLPPFFFKKYRRDRESIYAEPFIDMIYELWQRIYEAKQEGRDAKDQSRIISDFWTERIEEVKEGRKSAETETEIARDDSIMKRESCKTKEGIEGVLPRHVNVIDFGSGPGFRRTEPFIEICQKYGYEVGWRVGIDIAHYPEHSEEMELYNMSFIEAAQEPKSRSWPEAHKCPDLRSQFDIAKCDWTASSDTALIKEQMLNFAAFSLCLKENGLLILDTPFPEGPGSYESIIEAFKELYPDEPEGLFPWDFGEKMEEDPKLFFLYYYEILEKLLKDAGFETLNLPARREEREKYFQKMAEGTEDITTYKTDAYKSAGWEARGRPRITVVARKVRSPYDTENVNLFKELLATFGPRPEVIKNQG